VEGPNTNINFLAAVMRSKRFLAGALSTDFIAEEYPGGFAPIVPEGKLARLLASVAAAADQVMQQRKRRISGQIEAASSVLIAAKRSVMLGARRFDVEITPQGDGLAIFFEASGETYICVSGWKPGEPVWRGTIDGECLAVKLRPILSGH